MRVKLITRFAVLRLGILIGALGVYGLLSWNATHTAPFDFSDETMASFERIEAMLPEPSDEMTRKAEELRDLLVVLNHSFFGDGERGATSWLNYDEDEEVFSLVKGTRLEDLSPEFHQAVASLLKWHKQERGQVPMYSIRHPIYFDAIIQSGGMSAEKLQLMTSLYSSEQADEISIAFAHVAHFSWTSATGFADAMLPEIFWDFLDAKYPLEDQQGRIVKDWKPELFPQALRFASDVVTHFKIAQMQLVEDLVLGSEGNTEQAVENEYALLSSTTERILLGCRQGATPEEIALLFQPLLVTDLSYLVEFNQRIFRSVPVIRNHD